MVVSSTERVEFASNAQHAITTIVDRERHLTLFWHLSLSSIAPMPWMCTLPFHYLRHKHQGVEARQFLSTIPHSPSPPTVFPDNIWTTAMETYFGLKCNAAKALLSIGCSILHKQTSKSGEPKYVQLDEFGLNAAAAVGNTGSINSNHHDAIAHANGNILRDAGFMNVKEDPDTREWHYPALSPAQCAQARSAELHRSSSSSTEERAGTHKKPDFTFTKPHKSATTTDQETETAIFDVKTITWNTTHYPTSATELRKLISRHVDAEGLPTPPPPKSKGFNTPLLKIHRSTIDQYTTSTARLDLQWGRDITAELHRNGGVQPVVHGAFNETSITQHTISFACADLVAQKASKRGIVKDRNTAHAANLHHYTQAIGCAATKAAATRKLKALSYTGHTEAEALNTAKNSSKKPSFYRGSDADVDLTRTSRWKEHHHHHPHDISGSA